MGVRCEMGERGVERWCRVAGVWDRSALSCARLSALRDAPGHEFLIVATAGLQPCSLSSMLVCGQPARGRYSRGLFGGAAGVERTGRRRQRQEGATARVRCNVPGPGRASPSARLHVHNFVLRGGCRLRAASASRLPLSPGHPRTSPGNCARCSPAACVEGGLLSTDASLAVRPSPGLVGRPAISDRPSSLLSATLPACEPASDSLLSCPAGSCRTSCESPLFPGIPPSAIGHPERVLQDGALTRSAHPPPPKS